MTPSLKVFFPIKVLFPLRSISAQPSLAPIVALKMHRDAGMEVALSSCYSLYKMILTTWPQSGSLSSEGDRHFFFIDSIAQWAKLRGHMVITLVIIY